jgi:hypothetical protein
MKGTVAPQVGPQPGQLGPGSDPDAETRREDETERAVRCAACGARVTREAARMTMNGASEHSFMNPSGIRFVVACYASAPGCVPEGERSTVWTWFPGYAWQIELCRSCGVHLGWSFHGTPSSDFSLSFYGLVTSRVTRS